MDINNIKKTVSDAKVYWKQPMPGRYMPFKEIFAYSFGGIGIYFLIYCVQQLSLSTTNVIIGNAIGISPTTMYFIYVIAIIVSFPATAIRANIIDNARSKKGKYRPYLLSMALPSCALVIGMVMVPYEKISNQVVKAGIVLLFNIGFQFFYMFFYDSYENLILVLSPDTQERADVLTIKSVVYSLAPSIASAVLPLVAQAITNGDLYDMKLYRILYPPFAILGVLCAVYIYANSQEKIVQARSHVVQIKFTDAIRAVAKNKLFWVISLAGWVGFLETTYANMLQWCYQYHNENGISAGMYTIITMVVANANLWGMLAAPFAIRKWGKKKVLIITNAVNAFFLALLYPVVQAEPLKMIVYIAIVLFGNYLMTSFGVILNPAVQGDIRDYQQYITGERIDGMFSTVGLIGTVITLATSGVVPAVYEALGINDTTLAEHAGEIMNITGKSMENVMMSPYNVLYINDIFKQVFSVIVILSVIGAILNVIPFFFYDMTELRQRSIVKVLQLRAMFEDYGSGVLKDRDIVSTIEMIEEANEYVDAQPKDINALKNAVKSASSKEEKSNAKKELKAAKEFNDNVEISKIVMEEINKFSTPLWQYKLKEAEQIVSSGLYGLTAISMQELNEILVNAKAMPKTTKAEKEERASAIESAKNRISSKKQIESKYNGNIAEFDTSVFETLFEREDNNLAERTKLNEELSAAKKNKNAALVNEIKVKIANLKAEKNVIDAEIKKATDENSVYNRLAKPYIDAKKLIAQAENYQHYEDIKSMYEDAKVRAEEAEREQAEKAEKLVAEQKAMKEKLKAEKAQKKLDKKNPDEKKTEKKKSEKKSK